MNIEKELEIVVEDKVLKELVIVVEDEVLILGTKCCIYKVPTNLRRINEEAYTPQVISIGPFHHGKPELVYMETQKLAYQLQFRRRLGLDGEKMKKLWNLIEAKEKFIRRCYRESTFEFKSHTFIKMILYDAIFIIEYFLGHHKQDEYENHNPLVASIRRDLLLLENQVPYFILEELYHLSYSISSSLNDTYPHPFFITLVIWFFMGGQTVNDMTVVIDFSSPLNVFESIEHFTDLLRSIRVGFYPPSKEGNGNILLSSATKLKEAGIRFQNLYLFGKVDEDETILIDLKFKNKVLEISHIKVSEQSESLIRNIMALEQCHYPSKPVFCTYIYVLDCLINTEKDVDLLVEKGVIENKLGDNVVVAKMVNRLCLGIVTRNVDCYDKMISDLNMFSKSFWDITMANLKSVYFTNLWRGTGTIAAIFLLVLTLSQTILAGISFKSSKK